jgi:two-component system NarL family response regulator
VRVLLADDHAVVVGGLTRMIELQPDMVVVGEADNGLDTVDLWRTLRPDITLLDLRMPGLDGIGVITEIRRVHTAARMIVLTTYDTGDEIYRAIRAGARAYLLKDAHRHELLDAIRRVHAGETLVPSGVAAKLALRVSDDALTERETAVLELLADGKGNKHIAFELGIEESTVKSHLKRIFAKLHVTSRTEAVSVAIRHGLARR